MKDLTRFEYLQLAAAILPKDEIAKRFQGKTLEALYDALANELFLQAKIIQTEYVKRYGHELYEQFELEPADGISPQ